MAGGLSHDIFYCHVPTRKGKVAVVAVLKVAVLTWHSRVVKYSSFNFKVI